MSSTSFTPTLNTRKHFSDTHLIERPTKRQRVEKSEKNEAEKKEIDEVSPKDLADLIALYKPEKFQQFISLQPADTIVLLIPFMNEATLVDKTLLAMRPDQLKAIAGQLPSDHLARVFNKFTRSQLIALLEDLEGKAIQNIVSLMEVQKLLQIIPLMSFIQLQDAFEMLRIEDVLIASSVLTDTQVAEIAKCFLDSDADDLSEIQLTALHIVVAMSQKTPPPAFFDLIPQFLPKQMKLVIYLMQPPEFKKYVCTMNTTQLIDTFPIMSLDKIRLVFAYVKPFHLKCLIIGMPTSQLVKLIPHIDLDNICKVVKVLTIQQLWAVVPLLTEEQRFKVVYPILNCNGLLDELLNKINDAELIAAVTIEYIWEDISPHIDELTPNQLWKIAPVLTTIQLKFLFEELKDDDRIKSLVSNLTKEQVKNLESLVEPNEKKLKEIEHKTNEVISFVNKIKYNVQYLENKLSVTNHNFDKKIVDKTSKEYGCWINTIRLRKRSNKNLRDIDGHLATQCRVLEIIVKRIQNGLAEEVLKKSGSLLIQCVRLLSKNRSSIRLLEDGHGQTGLKFRINKLLKNFVTQEDAFILPLKINYEKGRGSVDQGINPSMAPDSFGVRAIEIYQGAKNALDSIAGTKKLLDEGKLGYEDLIEAGITSREKAMSLGLKTAENLIKHLEAVKK